MTTSSNRLIENQLHIRAGKLEKIYSGHVLFLKAPMYSPIDDMVKNLIEARRGERKTRFSQLVVLLETDGGYIEVAKRLAETFHHHYRTVDFLVPNYAMSAGTVLVMSGDAIHMDYYSVLGPIDPQFRREGTFVPGLGYLEKYKELISKANADGLNDAELAYLVSKFDPAFLHQIEHELELSVAYLKEWLVKYKFKDWKKTNTRGLKVTKKMKEERAKTIAEKLNDTTHWHSHSRGISMDRLRRELRLVIDDFGESTETREQVRSYYGLMSDYMKRRTFKAAIHQKGAFVGF